MLPGEYTTQSLTQQEVYVVRLDAIRLARRVRYLACGLAAGALAGGTLAMASSVPASAATSCQVAYSTNDWSTGFTASITITNQGTALTAWTLTYSYAGNQQLTQGWSGNWTQSGHNVTVTNASWNGSLATGASTQIGANFSYSGSNTAPTAFSINGTACNGSGVTSSPTPTPTSPTSSPTPTPTPTPTSTASGPAPQLHVSGNKLVNASGSRWSCTASNRSGTEYACVQGNGIFDGPIDQASITAMKSWGGQRGARAAERGVLERRVVRQLRRTRAPTTSTRSRAYVSLLNANGIVAILDLHWTDGTYTGPSSGCSSAQATCQKPMPDAAQAIPFWTSVATTFKGNDAVIFDLFNEPYASRADNNNSAEGWQCWETGSPCTGICYPVAGMQQMINAVRSAGANNVLMLGGEEYSNDLTGWLQLRADRPGPQPGRVLALLQLQHLQQPVLLDRRRWPRWSRRFRWSPARSARTTAPAATSPR